MPKNKLAGKGKNTRAGSNLSTGRDYSKDKEYQATPKRVAYRTELNRENRENPNSKVGDGKDVSHKKDGGTTLEAQSKNRARNRGKK